ncbi:MAG: C69 family dipeptidase [Sphaerochaetaceae bacterium]
MKKVLTAILIVMLIALESAAACTIFAVGKDATVDGSTITSHTCDSNGDDLRLWLIPSIEAGTELDVVVSGRTNADYSQYPAVRDYGTRGMVVGTFTTERETNQYLHGMYSFINEKGLAMGESTCSRERNTDQANKLKTAYAKTEGIYDCYMLQDLALENCDTASEAVDFMGKLIEEGGWNGACECINICDGNEAWVFEAYGGNIWCAVRVPDNAVFVAANRARIDYLVENDPANFRYCANIKSFALENGLWDGVSAFEPNNIYSPNKADNMGCTLREWRAISLLNPELYGNLDPFGDADEYPLFVVPSEKVSVDTIHKLCSDYYAGTQFDLSRTVQAGEFGNVLYNNHNTLKRATQVGIARPINMFRATYVQIASINAALPEAARCLVWVGHGAPSTIYLTPIFASQTELAPQQSIGLRSQYDEDSAWWGQTEVQNLVQINYESAIKDLQAVRDPKMATIYRQTAAAQQVAASLIELGREDLAISYLTTYANTVANDWFDTYKDLSAALETKYINGLVNMKVPARSDWWNNIILENMADNLKPLN